MKEKNNVIQEFYQSLQDESRGLKGRFCAYICLRTGSTVNTVLKRIRDDSWSPAERDDIMAAISDGRWRA